MSSIAGGDPRWRIAERSWLVGWWWGLFLVPLFVGVGADAQDTTTELSTLRGQNLLAVVAMLAAFVATVLGVLLVRRLDERQAGCRDAFGAG